MTRLLWLINRLRSMSGREIFWRLGGAITALFDVVRAAFRWAPAVGDVNTVTHDRFDPDFTVAPPGTVAGHFARMPESIDSDSLLASARMALENRISFFDLENQFLGDPIDWHRDFSSGTRGPVRHIAFTDYRDFTTFGDCKYVWEPNRHHQLVLLAQAYYLTGDAAYAKKVVEIMLHWIEENPFLVGMNWKSPLELGIRLINWVWAIDLIRSSNVLDAASWRSIVETAYRMTWEINRKYSRGSSANNHLIGEAAGVFVSTSYFQFFPQAREWQQRSKAILESELVAQTYADGCTREHAFGYQLFVMQFYSIARIVADRTNDPFSARATSRLHEMYRFTADICADTGNLPLLGDSDDGYVLDLGDRPSAPLGLISVGAQLFDDDSLLMDRSASAWWYFGSSIGDVSESNNSRTSRAYEDSGYFLLRSRSPKSGHRMSVLFDCAPLGFGPIAAHGHADCLSLTVAVNGLDFVVDSGTYDYFTFPEYRNYFRSTEAHNSVVIDDANQSKLLGPFLWGEKASPSLIDWMDSDEETRITGEYVGFFSLPEPITHRRTLRLSKNVPRLTILDEFETERSHRSKRLLHFHPDCRVVAFSDRALRVVRENTDIQITWTSGNSTLIESEDDRPHAWISDGYHRKRPSFALLIEERIGSDSKLECEVSPGDFADLKGES